MRRITFTVHPLSVAVGIACAVAVSFAASPAQSAVSALAHRIAIVGPVTIDGIYDPREAVVIREGTPFTVPAGRTLAITGVGHAEAPSGQAATIQINGVPEFGAVFPPLGSSVPFAGPGGSVVHLPDGLTAAQGSVVEVHHVTGTPNARAWGYLVDA